MGLERRLRPSMPSPVFAGHPFAGNAFNLVQILMHNYKRPKKKHQEYHTTGHRYKEGADRHYPIS